MKIAFLILAHHHPDRLSALVQTLDDPRFDIYIHADAHWNTPALIAEDFHLQHSTLRILPHRHRVFWGDISIVDATLSLYRYAIAHGEYSRFVLLSGEDYPIQSNDVIYAQLSQHGIEYINGTKLASSVRTEGYWFWKLPSRFLVRCIRKMLYILGIRKKPYININHQRWDIYQSSQWVALSRECVEYILSTIDANPQILSYFRFSHAPDEFIIPTIIYNSTEFKWKTTADLNRKYTFDELPAIHYLCYNPQHGSTVEYWDESVYNNLLSSGKLFLRKIQSGKSDKLVNMLDTYRNRI